VLGARAPWTERGSLSSWLLLEDDGVLVGGFGCRREKWLEVELEAGARRRRRSSSPPGSGYGAGLREPSLERPGCWNKAGMDWWRLDVDGEVAAAGNREGGALAARGLDDGDLGGSRGGRNKGWRRLKGHIS
jgi:hypothetical protein